MFRVAKTTPTKIGQFVTIWIRENPSEEITPFDIKNGIDYIFISVFDHFHKGFFIFEKTLLAKKNIMSVQGKGGKRAIRVYAPWTKPVVKQAIATQKWQIQNFVSLADINEGINRFKSLFNRTLL